MKFFICAFALVAAAFAAPPGADYSGYTKEGLARILVQESDQTVEGAHSQHFETENGISYSESGDDRNGANSVGTVRYTAPDGQVVEQRWSAGEQGYVVEGSHLPVAPAIPEEILRGLAWNAAHPEEEKEWDPENYKPVQPAYIGQPAYTGRK